MQVYLPIAEMSVDALLLLGIGFGVGWLSGMFGVGGGFLLTPLLILIGIPSPVAVASGANRAARAAQAEALPPPGEDRRPRPRQDRARGWLVA